MKSKYAEALDTLTELKGRANLASSTMRINCTCSEPEYRRECPWYLDWKKQADAADEYLDRVRAVFPASEARAIEIEATARAMEPSFLT